MYFTASDETWHGYVDILLNQTVTVLVLENSSLSGDQYQGDDSGGGDDDEREGIPGPPASK